MCSSDLDVGGEVDRDGRRVLFGHGRDEDGRAEEELQIDVEGVIVLRVLVKEGVQDGCAIDGGLVERGVEVVDKAVPVKLASEKTAYATRAMGTDRVLIAFLAASATVGQR